MRSSRYMKNRSLVSQFRITLVYILFAVIASTLLTWIIAAFVFMNAVDNGKLRPENYYEQQIPNIKQYVQEAKSMILSTDSKAQLDDIVQGDSFFYQTTDNEGNILYGSYEERVFDSKEKLYQSLNTTVLLNGHYVHVVPVIDDEGKIAGAVSLVYTLNLSTVNPDKHWISIILVLVILSPFIYMILFTILFSRNYAGNISHPLQILANGAQQIKNKNLDFEIHYHADNELGELCLAFTEMKTALKTSLSAQWKMEQERIEMVEALAHDLKSPLSIIKAYSEALVDDTDVDEEQRQYLSIMEENIEKSVSLVQQMQYTSELDSASVSLVKVSVNIQEFLKQKTTDYMLQGRSKNITVTLDFQNIIPLTVDLDINKLERILDNIVSNSLQYTPINGEIKISVKAENGNIYYRICDTGAGFSSKDLEKVFVKFYRGDEARQSKDGHSGLGLYIAKQLTELMGGTIRIENSKLGGGCVIFSHTI